MTLEEAQARIVELQEQNTALTNERDTLAQNNTTLQTENEGLRKLNQNYFNKLSAHYSNPADKKEDDEKVPTCEEFAKTLKI